MCQVIDRSGDRFCNFAFAQDTDTYRASQIQTGVPQPFVINDRGIFTKVIQNFVKGRLVQRSGVPRYVVTSCFAITEPRNDEFDEVARHVSHIYDVENEIVIAHYGAKVGHQRGHLSAAEV